MKRKALAFLLVLWLVISALTALEFISLTKANPHVWPEEAPPGYRINSDGTCDVESLSRDGDVYTFTGDIEGTIVIERDGVVLDGAGYALQGNGSSYGIWLQDRSNVTIKNLNIRNFEQGIRFSHFFVWPSSQTNLNHTTNCTIEACNITNSSYGVTFYSCLNCSVLRNYIANNTFGVSFSGSGNTFRSNKIEGNQYNFGDQDDAANDVDTSNTINGKPIYYWVNQQNMTVPDDAGLVILKHCTNINVQNLNLTGNGDGLTLRYTNESKIIGNFISDNSRHGIALRWSYNNSFVGNNITNNPSNGIYLYESGNNTISNNMISANEIGIDNYYSKNNAVLSNQIIANRRSGITSASNFTVTGNYIFGNLGIGIRIGSGSIVARNNITQNKGYGIVLESNCSIIDNFISKNDIGIWMYDGSGNTIMSNSIVENDKWGIRFQGLAQNNLIHHNNFIDNNNKSIQVFFHYIKVDDLGVNSWDDGVEGNYWSDYNGTGSCYINENNQDNYPLLAPLEFAALELPSVQLPQEANPTSEHQSDPFLITLFAAISIVKVAVVGAGFLFYFKKTSYGKCQFSIMPATPAPCFSKP